MIWSYNGYTSNLNESVIKIRPTELRTARGFVYAIERTITISGRIIRSNRSNLLTAIDSLKSAFSADGGDFYWRYADTTESGESITNATTIGGVRVSPPAFENGTAGEMSTFRDYSVNLTASIPIGLGTFGNAIVELTESVEHTNPGADGNFELLPLKSGVWQVQTGYKYGKHVVTQSGVIVGLYDWPAARDPIYAASPPLKKNLTHIRQGEPKLWINGVGFMWPVTYSYQFESPTPLLPLATPVL